MPAKRLQLPSGLYVDVM